MLNSDHPSAGVTAVAVQFERHGDQAVAQKLRFPTEREILVTRGAIEGIDLDDEQLILENSEGTRELELGIGYGAMIESPRGLIDLDDLRSGQDVSVYYEDPSTAYLVVVNG